MPGSKIPDYARNQSLNGAQSPQEVEAAARPSPVPYALRRRKPRRGPWAPSRSMRRQTCRAFPGGAVPSGAAAEHDGPAAPLSAAEEWPHPPLDSALPLQREQPPLWRAACASGTEPWPLPSAPKQSLTQSSSNRAGRLPARLRENLVRVRGGLFHHQVERLFRSVWSCTIILSPSALFCRLSALWELMPKVIRSELPP
jgi:hypothetical protein